jgi:guanylate kinase
MEFDLSSENGYGHHPQPLLIVISGPSGVGKDSVLQSLKERQLALTFVVTATTRPPRPDEVDGVDYFFISETEFQRMIDEEEFIEHALVYDDYKGVPKEQIRQAMASGQDVVMRVDVQGAATIRKMAPEALLIFLTTNSEEELVERLKSRKTETPEKLKKRIDTARQELERIDEFDYRVVNEDSCLETTVDTIISILEAEHHAVKPRKVEL